MKNAFAAASLMIIVYALTAVTAAGQQGGDSDVVKVTTKLVQVDVVVTDKDGNQVSDLTADDFVLIQDGRPQKITGVTYVGSAPELPAPATKETEKNSIATPPVKVRPAEAKRIITFVVDDGNCLSSFSGMIAAREGIEKFIREQKLPGDLVAIYRTRSGTSMMQQYTSDTEQLLAAAKKVRWLPVGGSCGGDGSFFEAARVNNIDLPGKASVTVERPAERAARVSREDFDRDNQTIGSLGVLRYVIGGLQDLPGRKVVFFISDGMPLISRGGQFLRAKDVLRDLTDFANRASVVVNTVNNRGLIDPSMIEARDEISVGSDPRATSDLANSRQTDIENSHHGLSFLAYETGGRFYHDQNFLDKPIAQALRREKGYYLVAYEPDEQTFQSKEFNSIDVRVLRAGLRLLSRSGFLPFTSEAATQSAKKRTRDGELYAAILAPSPKPGLNVQLSAFFVNSGPGANLVRALFHVDGGMVTFLDAPGGRKKAALEVVAVTLNERNDVVDEFTRTHDFTFEAAVLPHVQKNGLVYSTDVPIKKPGTYNFRVAVRDASSQKIGTAIQVLHVPDIKKAKLFVGGLTMTAVDNDGKFSVPGPVSPDNAISLPSSTSVPAIRRFKRGSVVAFAYTLYNARVDTATSQPKLTVQMKLYRDGKVVLEGKAIPADLEKQSDWARIQDYGRMQLNPKSIPGDYALQIVVTDTLADGKDTVASQWIDFEIVE